VLPPPRLPPLARRPPCLGEDAHSRCRSAPDVHTRRPSAVSRLRMHMRSDRSVHGHSIQCLVDQLLRSGGDAAAPLAPARAPRSRHIHLRLTGSSLSAIRHRRVASLSHSDVNLPLPCEHDAGQIDAAALCSVGGDRKRLRQSVRTCRARGALPEPNGGDVAPRARLSV
jgi:hypothetical protein